MKIEYITGNLLTSGVPAIVHGCNAQGVMRSGVAKQIREKYPFAYDAYMEVYNQGRLRLGGVSHGDNGDVIILNAVTQEFYGRDPNVVYVNYLALRQCFRKLNSYMTCDIQGDIIGMPLIGAGLANGSWTIISKIIEEEAVKYKPVVYLLDGIVPD